MDGPIFYLDWKPQRLDVLRDEETTVKTFFIGLRQFVKENVPCTIILESTFESYNPAEHNAIIEQAAALGARLQMVAGRASGRRVREMFPGFKPAKDDALVPFAIRDIVQRGHHLTAPRFWSVVPDTTRSLYERKRRSDGFAVRDPWVKERMARFPPWKALPEVHQEMFANHAGSNYDLPFVMSMLPAFEEARSARDLMDRVIGARGNGYPSFYRSQFMRRGMVLLNREHGKKKRSALSPEERSALHGMLNRLRSSMVMLYHCSRGAQL